MAPSRWVERLRACDKHLQSRESLRSHLQSRLVSRLMPVGSWPAQSLEVGDAAGAWRNQQGS